VYIADPSLIGSRLFDKMSQIKKYKDLSKNGKATGMIVELDSATITMNFMPSEEIPKHLEGLNGFVSQTCLDKDNKLYALSRIYNIRFVIGCVIDSALSKYVETFLLDFTSRLNGLLFINNSLIDHDGTTLAKLVSQ
jgi:hypothetical protein